MAQHSSTPDLTAEDALSSYRFIQVMIGVVAFVLPVGTLWWGWVINHQHLDSISMTYHSHTRNVFVGCLCALGLAFASYARRGRFSRRTKWGTGQRRLDGWLSIVAGTSAIGIALFPTVQCETEGAEQACPGYASLAMIFSTLHAIFTGILMLTIASFCLYQFVRTDAASTQGQPLVKRAFGLSHTVPVDKAAASEAELSKMRQNCVYRIAGGVIVVCILWIAVVNLLVFAHMIDLKPHVGVQETVAVWAFGVAWLTKSGYYAWFHWLFRPVTKHLKSR